MNSYHCEHCNLDLTEAEKFLHDAIHLTSKPPFPHPLGRVPYHAIPALAKIMEDYHEKKEEEYSKSLKDVMTSLSKYEKF